jgi:2-oxoisovalerate dehydrogenase E2 component (dihydrolipoyl transacylase)
MVIAMANQFLLPDLGEGLTEAEIVAWLVSPGDIIAIDQPVVEVESAKSTVELPSPYGGRVEFLHAAAGDVVQKGSPLLTILSTADSVDVVPGTAIRSPEPDSTSGAVLVGYGTKESEVKLRGPESGRFRARVAHPQNPPQLAAPSGNSSRRSPVISPIVRKRAHDNGIDASQLEGSGPGALVVRSDVEAAISALAGLPAEQAEAQTSVSLVTAPGDTRTPLSGMRKLIGARLSASRTIIPEATIWLDVDATELVSAKSRLHSSTGERYSLTALIARFVVAGLAQYPILNSSIDAEAGEIIHHRAIGLGLAAQTPRGLMVPVVQDAGSMTTRELRDSIAALVQSSEKGDFPHAALTGGTFTLNNYGGFGVDGSTPIINYPEVAMLGVGRIIDRPWVVNGELGVRKVVTLSLVFDHRACDGDVASGFLTFVARCIEEPLTLLGSV